MSAFRGLLVPFSGLYGAVVSVRNFGYDRHFLGAKKLSKPVISVGNISVGGSGKTPFVMYLIERVLSLGAKPAVLSRGYKRLTSELIVSCPDAGTEADVRLLGDEPALISQTFRGIPVAVKGDRYEAGLAILERFEVDVFILDDGFQNRELHRDADIVLLNSSLQDVKDRFLPAGNLRDSKSRLREADALVLTSHGEWNIPGSDFMKDYLRIPVAGISFLPVEFGDVAGNSHPLEIVKGKKVASFCGIANPKQFFSGLEALGAEIISKKVYRDHHWFDEYDLDEIFGGREDLTAVTTSKDAVRIFLDADLAQEEEAKRIFALRERAVVNFGKEEIDNLLTRVMGQVYA